MSVANVENELKLASMATSTSIFKSPEGLVFGWGTTVGNGIEGWAPNAIFIDTDASQGSAVFTNTGSKTTATWTEIADAGVAGGFAMTSGSSITVGSGAVATFYGEGMQDHGNEAITATTGGGTTGLISQGTKSITVTSDSANKQISLPAATVGDEIWIQMPATGCELISAVAGHKVNNVIVGATNELALVGTSLYHCKYVALNAWIVRGFTNLGADEAALVPDAL
ncbi:MAG: hypothetical protein V3V96_14460 [Acidiferrobacterales bacterium]